MKAIPPGIFLMYEHNVAGAAVDNAHFEIMVKAMLCWSDEAKAPKKTPGRATMPVWPRDELDDEEDEAIVDGDGDDDDEPGEALHAGPAGGEPIDGDPGEAGLPVSQQLD
jgi:hypothetical protein